MTVSKEHLLEWTTAEEAERQNKNTIAKVYSQMLPNILVGIVILALIPYSHFSTFARGLMGILGVLFLLFPSFMWEISEEKQRIRAISRLSKEEQEYIKDVAKRTWDYFAEYMNKENSYLPPDNFQESRREKIANRTSSTNIGLGILTIISAYDLKFITLEKVISCLENTMSTIESLEKWDGHLLNWYNTKTLKPLLPRYVSSVDSGNFVRIHVYS